MTKSDGTLTAATRGATRLASRALGAALGAVVAGAALAPAAAQQQDGRWLAWTGCWEPVTEATAQGSWADLDRRADRVAARRAAAAPENRDPGASDAGEASGARTGPMVCFQPADRGGVERFSVEDGAITGTETLFADGERHETTAEGCAGWERAEFSTRSGRAFVTSERECEGGVTRTSSGILSMVSAGEWVDVQAVTAGGQTGTWVTRYRQANPADVEAAGFGDLVAPRDMAVRAARVAASAPPTVDDVIEASDRVAPEAVQAWLFERDAALDLDDAALVRLADAGVPEDVIDMAIAVTYPERFAVDRDEARYDDRYAYASRYGYGRYGRWSSIYGSIFYSPWGLYGPFGYGYGYGYGPYGYGYGPYGYGYGYPYYGRGYGGYYGGPIRIVPIGRGDSGGRVISGQGYRRGSGGSARGGTAVPRSGGAARSGGTRQAVPRSSGARSSGSGSSGSSSGRTAKKRGSGGGGSGSGR